jgi:hypothetical protein
MGMAYRDQEREMERERGGRQDKTDKTEQDQDGIPFGTTPEVG